MRRLLFCLYLPLPLSAAAQTQADEAALWAALRDGGHVALIRHALAPGTGDMAISVAQALPNAELVVVTTPQPSASDIAVRSGLVALQVPMKVRGVVENMSYYEHKGEKLRIFGEGGGARVSEQLTHSLGYEVPLLAQLPLEPELRETGEAGRPAVLTKEGALRSDGIGETFKNLAESLMRLPQ